MCPKHMDNYAITQENNPFNWAASDVFISENLDLEFAFDVIEEIDMR
jgi:hypothetical protein